MANIQVMGKYSLMNFLAIIQKKHGVLKYNMHDKRTYTKGKFQ